MAGFSVVYSKIFKVELEDFEFEPHAPGIRESATDGEKPITGSRSNFRVGDRVIHQRNNCEHRMPNGGIGVIKEIDHEEPTCMVSFFRKGGRLIDRFDDLPGWVGSSP